MGGKWPKFRIFDVVHPIVANVVAHVAKDEARKDGRWKDERKKVGWRKGEDGWEDEAKRIVGIQVMETMKEKVEESHIREMGIRPNVKVKDITVDDILENGPSKNAN